jgi:hypothetical protein
MADKPPRGFDELVDYWEIATEALERAGIPPRRAAGLAWEGIKMALEAQWGPCQTPADKEEEEHGSPITN